MRRQWEPWVQQPDETSAEWHAFVAYRDGGGKRTVASVAEACDLSPSAVYAMARRRDWEARVRAWDAFCDLQRREAFLALQRRTIKEHVKAAQLLRGKAVSAVGKITPEQLAAQPRVAVQCLEVAVRIEQQSLGIPTEVTALTMHRGQVSDPREAYFESLDRGAICDLAETALAELRRQQSKAETTAKHQGE